LTIESDHLVLRTVHEFGTFLPNLFG